MKTKMQFVITLLSLVLVVGCSREQKPETEASSKSTPTKEMASKAARQKGNLRQFPDDAVLIRWGTNEFTMGMAKRLIDLRVKFIKLSMPKGQEINVEDAISARVLASAPFSFPRDCAVADFAATNGIVIGEKDIALMRKRAMQGAKQGFSSWPSFMRKLTAEERATLNERIRIEALAEGVRKWHVANRPAILTDDEIAQYRSRQRKYNEMAEATNRLTFVQATNVWRSIQKGLSFDEAVAKYSTDESNNDNGVWGDFTSSYFSDNSVIQGLLQKLEPGQITPPVEGDNGLMILRLDSKRIEGDGQSVYTLSRVFFHLPEFYPEMDDETFAKQLREARQNRCFNDFVTQLAAKLPPAYPSGEKVFENAKRTAAEPTLF